MFRLTIPEGIRHCDGLTRRDLLRVGSIGFGGLSLPSLLRARAMAETGPAARAKSVVVLYLSGGPSQLDMWDLKPDAPVEIRGTFRPIATRIPGLEVCEHLPGMARIADKYAIIRSMSHGESEHLRAGYWVMTGSPLLRSVAQSGGMKREDRPHIGSVLASRLGMSDTIPPFVMIPEYVSPVGIPRPGQFAGFLGAAHDPFVINSDPNLQDYSPGELKPVDGLSPARMGKRRSLLSLLEQQMRYLEKTPSGRSLVPYHAKAFDLISTPSAQAAFDVTAEPDKVRDRYGRHIFGQSVLVARRLVEAGVRLVQVNYIRHDRGKGGQGYDSHSVPPSPPHLPWAKNELLPPTDAAFTALVEDLDDRGLLDETLIVMMGEFGRTPRFNQNGGRDHWPLCYSTVVAGGGIRGGQVYGSSDKIASTPTSNPVSVEDLMATMYHLTGIDRRSLMFDLQERPFPLSDGEPVYGLL